MPYIAAITNGAQGAPLVFTFHGTGGDEHQFHGFARQLLPDAHVVSPRGDVSENGMSRYFRRTAEGIYDMQDLALRTEAMAHFMTSHKARVGADRVVALGYSNGANILASVALTHPDIVDDLIMMHPLIPWDPTPQPGLKDRRILITAGQQDPICPAPQTTKFVDYLMSQNANVTTQWHMGGHDIGKNELTAIANFLG